MVCDDEELCLDQIRGGGAITRRRAREEAPIGIVKRVAILGIISGVVFLRGEVVDDVVDRAISNPERLPALLVVKLLPL